MPRNKTKWWETPLLLMGIALIGVAAIAHLTKDTPKAQTDAAPSAKSVTEAPAAQVDEPKAQDLRERFAPLLDDSAAPDAEAAQLASAFEEAAADYGALIYELQYDSPVMAGTLFTADDRPGPASCWSPITAALYAHQDDIHVNPVALTEKMLVKEMAAQGRPLETFGYTVLPEQHLETVDTFLHSKLTGDPNRDVRRVLGLTPSDPVGYSPEEDLYYAYTVSVQEDLVVDAYYLFFEWDGTISKICRDRLVVTTKELDADDPSLAELRGGGTFDPTTSGVFTRYNDNDLASYLGECPVDEAPLPVTAQTSYKVLTQSAGENGTGAVSCIHLASWYALADHAPNAS